VTAPVRKRFRRSPFLLLYWSGQDAIVLDAHSLARWTVHPSLVAFLSRLESWSTAEELNAAGMAIDEAELDALAEAGLIEAALRDQIGTVSEPAALFEWDPLELAVQRRTARGGVRSQRAASGPPVIGRRFADRPETMLPPPCPISGISLGAALEQRRSIRTYGSRPLSLAEISTLLHHAARVLERTSNTKGGELLFRPFPSAGANSELEIYLVADGHVGGLSPGAHYFDAVGHRLRQVRQSDGHHRDLLRSVHEMAGGELNRDPAVIVLVTAVFERVMWKYHDLGLSLIYKDVGGLFQTLYLVATACGLAACALGAGDEAANSRWLGLDPLVESQVGCFLIGPRECSSDDSSNSGRELDDLYRGPR